jgi:hypothetical protein
MARSSYIYLLIDSGSGDFVGAWTVKHEMLAFRERYSFKTYWLAFRDGQPAVPPKSGPLE